jgi:hypothetical protein
LKADGSALAELVTVCEANPASLGGIEATLVRISDSLNGEGEGLIRDCFLTLNEIRQEALQSFDRDDEVADMLLTLKSLELRMKRLEAIMDCRFQWLEARDFAQRRELASVRARCDAIADDTLTIKETLMFLVEKLIPGGFPKDHICLRGRPDDAGWLGRLNPMVDLAHGYQETKAEMEADHHHSQYVESLTAKFSEMELKADRSQARHPMSDPSWKYVPWTHLPVVHFTQAQHVGEKKSAPSSLGDENSSSAEVSASHRLPVVHCKQIPPPTTEPVPVPSPVDESCSSGIGSPPRGSTTSVPFPQLPAEASSSRGVDPPGSSPMSVVRPAHFHHAKDSVSEAAVSPSDDDCRASSAMQEQRSRSGGCASAAASTPLVVSQQDSSPAEQS